MRTESMKVEVAIPIKRFTGIEGIDTLIPIGKPFTVSHLNAERGGGGTVVLIDAYGERHPFSLEVFRTAFVEVKS